MIDLQARLKKASFWWQVGGAATILFIVGPVLLIVLKAALALAGLAAMFAIAMMAGPVWGMKLANWQMKAVIEEATRNPIETRWNNYAIEQKNLEVEGSKIQKFEAKILLSRKKLVEAEHVYGANDPAVMELREADTAMSQLLGFQWDDYKAVKASLEQKKRSIEKMSMLYDVAMAQQDAASSSNAKLTVLQEIAEKAAINAADEAVAMSMAQLKRRLMERVPEGKPAQLQAPNVIPIEGKVIKRELARV